MISPGEPSASRTAAGDAKAVLRARLLARRRARPAAQRAAGSEAVSAALLRLPEAGRVACVAAYAAVGSEPSVDAALDALAARGVRVLLPVLQKGLDVEWAERPAAGAGLVASAVRPRLREPAGPSLGTAAVAEAGLVVAPALAVGRDGTRLGRGGGSYDRALRRVAPGALVVAVVWADELLDTVPTEPHDASVGAVATPDGVLRLPAT
ncbi:5-formyltetrahydrofolate cyclo-ligase [Motilibacter aurantiacus]|uniref:5-formyltetrahydrofolate cyclo-ligase n=1 Tax=Motilibacter aurantiacus TaxID=2714955 RepID=UPI00140E3FBC|nr:5-formyltetrahydrofolate cyclo-ligase [Motilibacter aurantiacus]NHC45944.1 5-formyltetrahydrofolate cyclo-ligase [Motilibacter aurantiacus]